MNLKRFNLFKNSLYFYIASAVVLTAGLIVGLILGLNSQMVLGGQAYLYTILSVIVFSVVAFVYFAIKYEVFTAFTIVLSICFNVCLTTALASIIRTEVNETFVMAVMLVCVLTIASSIITFGRITNEQRKPVDREKMVNQLVNEKLRTLVITMCTVIVILLCSIFIFDASAISFVRVALLGVVSCLYSSVFLVVPFWGRFVKEKKNRRVNLGEDYVK